MVTGSFLGVKSGRGVTLTPHPLLVPWSWKNRAIPLLPLWAVRPVQSLSACTRGRFTLSTLPFCDDCNVYKCTWMLFWTVSLTWMFETTHNFGYYPKLNFLLS